ncbi:sugar phosphate isomerase/epimerase family protein [Flavivirga rizhaonensis]|uniref:Sugar phosphate isomerase/epimerase n=1 Tax=Flavivirga rizhaonensis TaxID=2559571 RepID=A0A4S1DQR7_9FLAO|nr:sugar phosphate isomerase/epimerase [Flavivirga rizhaonensis]TGV00240.1 sugar phosphate isomerase/epimerase [Flavivirga rizhaonensis]
MHIKFFCPYWGSEHLDYTTFLHKIKEAGYDGTEIILPYDKNDKDLIVKTAKQLNLEIIALWGGVIEGNFSTSIKTYEEHLRNACSIQPLFVNIQTGKDHYTYEQNMEFIHLAQRISEETRVKVVHETHRGKFSFAAHITREYLEKNPWIRITADFSHWCNVSESLLEDQPKNIEKAIANTDHIHARVGFAEGPQIPDPRTPEWQITLDAHISWWDRIIELKRSQNAPYITISPEFGPFPYMVMMPFTGLPISSQWDINLYMKNLLKARYKE